MSSTDDQYAPETLRERLRDVRRRIDRAVEQRKYGDGDVELIAVSKTHPVEAIETLYDSGVRSFGASYVQEWEDKVDELPDDIRWHFVGRLQSNKAKRVADRVAMVHSIDRKSVTKKLAKRCDEPMDVLLQVDPAGQDSKGGVAPEGIENLMDLVADYPALRVRGLMGMPPYVDDPEDNRPHFRRLRETLHRLQEYVESNYPERREGLEELSMGMTNDFEVAIEEGATMIRLGTALFGKRDYDD